MGDAIGVVGKPDFRGKPWVYGKVTGNFGLLEAQISWRSSRLSLLWEWLNSMMFFHSYGAVYQRVALLSPMIMAT